MVASESTVPDPISATENSKKSKNPKISVTREHTEIQVLLVRLWHSSVSAPSARQEWGYYLEVVTQSASIP